MDQVAQATAGGAAGMIAVGLMYPLVLAKTRLQAQRKQTDDAHYYEGPVDCLVKVFKHEGALGLFKGVKSFLPKAFVTNFIFYFVHAALKPVFKVKNFASNMLHGILAGVVVQIIMTPFELVNTRVVIDKTGKTRFRTTFMKLLKNHGFGWFYAGIGPQLLLTLNPGITNVARQKLESVSSQIVNSPVKDFWIGAGSKAIASTITYPLVVCKVHMQTQHLDESDADENVFMVGKRIVKNSGISGLYNGLETQLGTAILKEAILNMFRKEIYRIILRLFNQHPTK